MGFMREPWTPGVHSPSPALRRSLDSAGRSGLLRCASARPPLTATSGLDSGDGRSSEHWVSRDFETTLQPCVCSLRASRPELSSELGGLLRYTSPLRTHLLPSGSNHRS